MGVGDGVGGVQQRVARRMDTSGQRAAGSGQRAAGSGQRAAADSRQLRTPPPPPAQPSPAAHLADGVRLPDVGQELVAQPLALAGARHQASDVHKLDGGGQLRWGESKS
jgi:hypothetical protein